MIDRHDGVFAGHQPQKVRILVRGLEPADHLRQHVVEFHEGRGGLPAIGSVFLRGVVEMRQVDVEEVRAILLGGDDRRFGDPVGRLDIGERSPKVL